MVATTLRYYVDVALAIGSQTTIISTYTDPDRFEKNLKSLREFLHKFGRETNQGEVVFEFAGEFFRIHKYDLR